MTLLLRKNLKKAYNKFEFYIHFFTFKALSAIVYNLAIYFYIKNSLMSQAYQYLIIQEVILSTVFYTLKVKLMKNRQQSAWYCLLSFFLCCISVAMTIFVFGLSIDVLLLSISLLIFPLFLLKSVYSESNDVDLHVKKENISAFLAAILASLFIITVDVLGFELSSVLLFRGLLFSVIFLVFLSKVTVSYKVTCKGTIFQFLSGFEYFAFLFFFKFVFFELLEESSWATGVDIGWIIKTFLYSYDLIAALLGLYLRRIYAKNIDGKSFEYTSVSIFNTLNILGFVSLFLFYLSNYFVFLLFFIISNFIASASSLTHIVTMPSQKRLMIVVPSFAFVLLGLYFNQIELLLLPVVISSIVFYFNYSKFLMIDFKR